MDPPRTDVRLGYLCNNNCRFCCVSHQEKKQISTAEAKRTIELAKEKGSKKIVFTGGEATIRKDIIDLVSFAKSLGFDEILIITNGRMCSYPDFLEKLVDAGLTNLCFSLPHYKEKEYEYLTRVKGSYKQLMKAIENAKKYDLFISTITVITELNYKDLLEITDFLIKTNKDFNRFFSEFVLINPTDNAWKYKEELVPRLKDIAPYIHQSLEKARKANLMLNVEGVPFCYMKGYENNIVELHMAKERMYVSPTGDLELDHNMARKTIGKAKGVFCRKCKYDSICEGVWTNYAKIYGTDELKYE